MTQPQTTTDAMLFAYTDMMKTFLNTQRDVMLAALGTDPTTLPQALQAPILETQNFASPPPIQQISPPPAPIVVTPTPEPVVSVTHINDNGHANGNGKAHTNSVAVAPAPAKTLDQASIQDELVALVADRTGYPAEMIQPDLDLEADLGIDSIKRVEILSAFQDTHGDAVADIDMEDLTAQKTLSEISNLIASSL